MKIKGKSIFQTKVGKILTGTVDGFTGGLFSNVVVPVLDKDSGEHKGVRKANSSTIGVGQIISIIIVLYIIFGSPSEEKLEQLKEVQKVEQVK